jgi:hypothetical protein
MPYTYDDLTFQYDASKYMLKRRLITRAEHNRTIRALNDEQDKRDLAERLRLLAIRTAEADARREAKRKAYNAKRKEQRKEQRMQSRASLGRGEVIADTDQTGMADDIELYAFYKKIVGVPVRLVNIVGGKVVHDVNETFTSYKKDFRFRFISLALGKTESEVDFSEFMGRWIALAPSKITQKAIMQQFRDGVEHCVFTPILNKLSAMLESCDADARKKRLSQRIKAIQKYEVEYEKGVPEDKMEEIYKVAGFKMTRYDVMNNETVVYNKDGKVGALRTKNTRINHIDEVVVDCDYETVSNERMKEIYESAKGSHFEIDGNIREGVPIKLRTLTGAYKLENPIADACVEFDKEVGIPNYRINAVKYPELNEFVKEGRIVNAWTCDINGGDATDCADMPAAYTQFKKCEFYGGFLGHIQQFRSGSFSLDFIRDHIGYYRVTLTGGVEWLMSKVGFSIGSSYIMFSQEILYYASRGVSFTSDVGAWGSRFDFEFSREMIEPIMVDGKKQKLYAHWTGRLGMEHTHTSTTFPCSSEFASHLACDYEVFFYREHGLATIKTPLSSVYTSHHIFGAITAYTRIQMMEAMRQFEPSQICRVVMDGIYYNGAKPASLAWFSDKKGALSATYTAPWFSDVRSFDALPMSRIIDNSALLGQGGSGKSHSVLADPGFINVLFVAPTQLLGLNMAKKYGCRWTTVHKLIGLGCVPYHKEHPSPSIILGDELSMWSVSWVQATQTMYPDALLLLAGDIDLDGHAYQCTMNEKGERAIVWKPSDMDIVRYENDYRSKDSELKTLKLRIRSQMDLIHDDEINAMMMKMWALKHLPISESIMDFVEGRDTVIAGTHRTNANLLQGGVVSGWYKKGGHISSVSVEGYEKRGSFTIHSYQGQTIESGNVWIVIDDMFDYAMLYTAVSRCVSFSQLRFVKKI